MTIVDEVRGGEAQLVDVRTLDEWDAGHAQDAMHIPLDELCAGMTDSLTHRKKVYTYCQAGGRAAQSAKYLTEHGYRAESIGGLEDWIRVGGSLATQ